MSKSDDLRLDSLVNKSIDDPIAKIALIGYPCDEGVKRNGGRLGAKLGPQIFRQYLSKIGSVVNPEFGTDLTKIEVKDYGNAFDMEIEVGLEMRHQILTTKVKQALDEGYLPFVVGGGNDQSYPNARALMGHLGNGDVAVINIDAHLDVRPLLGPENLAHSGSPFRQLLEDVGFHKNFVEFACQGAVCGSQHAHYVKSKGGKIWWLSNLRASKTTIGETFRETLKNFGENRPIFVSFDVDSIRSSDCPGVSAPATLGLEPSEALAICQEAGRNKNVKLFDLSEFNPQIESDRTGRLVVHMFYYFLLGVAERCANIA